MADNEFKDYKGLTIRVGFYFHNRVQTPYAGPLLVFQDKGIWKTRHIICGCRTIDMDLTSDFFSLCERVDDDEILRIINKLRSDVGELERLMLQKAQFVN